MKKFLIVVDMQKDFIDGALGSSQAQAIVPHVVQKILDFDGEIFVTYDTHSQDYLQTMEGKKLPVPHCIKGTAGWELDSRIAKALQGKSYISVEKPTFGSVELPELIRKAAGDEPFSLELVGLCTDICVVSNAMLLKANFCEAQISVDASCCAGVTEATHQAALDTMRCCHIDILPC